jgi:hypothetical protein
MSSYRKLTLALCQALRDGYPTTIRILVIRVNASSLGGAFSDWNYERIRSIQICTRSEVEVTDLRLHLRESQLEGDLNRK